MSVNDQLPWIEAELALLRDADACGVPIIGHCLGGQVLARAFGAVVDRSPHVEIGWSRLQIDDAERTREWFGESAADVEYFQWHEDAFGLPTDAYRLLRGHLCPNQAYVIERAGYAHIGMQFHIEMTADLIRLWASDKRLEGLVDATGQCTGAPSVQSTAAAAGRELRVERMREVATTYDRWLRGARD
jgi:GMP synthase-like glutamine amidotransferase